jgi:phosphoribosylamine-glycine ligase
MNILILGSGGREHALAWKIAASPLAERLYCAPGNAGIAQEAEIVPLDIADHAAVAAFCRAQAIGLVVVGPEAPLCAGIVDDLGAAGIKAFGPTGSKDPRASPRTCARPTISRPRLMNVSPRRPRRRTTCGGSVRRS